MNVNVCVSDRDWGSRDEDRLVCALSVSGANTVRYGRAFDASCSANGLVGRGDVGRAGRDILPENGSNVERRDDIGIGACWGAERLVCDASSEVSKELKLNQ